MGRTIFCEEKAIEPLKGLPNTCGFIPGLIIGQYTENKEFVIHLPQTQNFCDNGMGDYEPDNNERMFNKVMDIPENLISDHCRTVTRMLPGGMWILGLYIVGPGDIFSDKNSFNKLRTLANAVHNCTKSNEHMCGRDPSNQKLIFHFCSLSKKYMCKSLDMNTLTSTFRPVDWKIKSDITTWLKVKGNHNLTWLPTMNLPIKTDNLKLKLQEVLVKYQQYLDGLIYSINNQFCSSDRLLITVGCYKDQPYEMMLYEKPVDQSNDVTPSPGTKIKLFGVIKCEVYVNSKSTVEDAFKAMKDDLLRSLASRLEMHWQTFELPLDIKCPYILRRPPRRVLFIPENSAVSFSEYLFDGETKDDALASIKENLGLSVGRVSLIEGDWEKIGISEVEDSVNGLPSTDTTEKKKVAKYKTIAKQCAPLAMAIIIAGLSVLLLIFIRFQSS